MIKYEMIKSLLRELISNKKSKFSFCKSSRFVTPSFEVDCFLYFKFVFEQFSVVYGTVCYN